MISSTYSIVSSMTVARRSWYGSTVNRSSSVISKPTRDVRVHVTCDTWRTSEGSRRHIMELWSFITWVITFPWRDHRSSPLCLKDRRWVNWRVSHASWYWFSFWRRSWTLSWFQGKRSELIRPLKPSWMVYSRRGSFLIRIEKCLLV